MNTCKTEQEYINQIAEPARRCCKRYGYLPSVLIAQSCLENGYGIPSYFDNPQIVLLLRYNNMVGIKSELLNKSWTNVGLTVWPGKSLNKDTPEVYKINGRDTKVTANADFRKYDSIEQSFADYLCFMTWGSYGGPGGAPKYGQKVLSIKDPAKLIETVHQLGYATGRTYASNVKRIIAKHDLTRYDELTGVIPTSCYPAAAEKEEKTVVKYKTVEEAMLKGFGINMIDNTAANRSQIPSTATNARKYFVIHYRGVNGENPNLFKSTSGSKGFGAQYDVSKTGKVYRVTADTAVVWQVGASGGFKYIHDDARNDNCVGVECGTYTKSGKDRDEETWYFTEETQEAAAKLAAAFLTVYGLPISRLLRHGDVTTKNCPSPLKRDEGQGSNWTWAKFRSRVAGYMEQLGASSGSTTVLKLGMKGESVTTLQEQLMLTGFADCSYYLNPKSFVTGTYDAQTEKYVRKLQKAAGIDVDGLYGPISQAALARYVTAAKASSIDFTVETFLKTAKEVAAQNKKNGFSYGNASCLPAVSSEDKLTSCDRFVDQVLWACGVKDIGNRSVTAVADFLASKGAKKITNVSKVKAGDVIFFKEHTFILGNKVSEGIWERYDSGSKERIQLTGAYAGYKSQPFKEGLSGFLYAYRLPFKTQAVTTGSVIYRVQVGAYSVKANAEKRKKAVESAGFPCVITDYGSGVKDRYSVQIGAYSVKANAKKQRDAAKAKGVNAIIRTVKS